MINTLIFDFGNVFININSTVFNKRALDAMQLDAFPKDIIDLNVQYEIGEISSTDFINYYVSKFPHVSKATIISIWNSMLGDFPIHRLNFIQQLQNENKYKLILLSNTNALHIDWLIENLSFFDTFKSCFSKFYLSHEIHLRKPNANIFEFVLRENKLHAQNCLFIDDLHENCIAAEELGIHTWNINPLTEDVSTLFKTKLNLF